LEAALSLETLSRALALEGLADWHARAVEHGDTLQEVFGEGGRFCAAEHPVAVFVKLHQSVGKHIRWRPAAKWAAWRWATGVRALATAKPWTTARALIITETRAAISALISAEARPAGGSVAVWLLVAGAFATAAWAVVITRATLLLIAAEIRAIAASPPRGGAVALSRRHRASREWATGKTLARVAAGSPKATSWAKRPRESRAKFFAAEAAVAVFVEGLQW
jgi:hypothetical protein